VGACSEGCFHGQTPLHRQSPPRHPPTQHPSQRPGDPWFSDQSSLAPSPRAVSTEHVHRLPPPRLSTTTADKGFLPSARVLSLLGSRSHAASQQLRTLSVHRDIVVPKPSYVECVVHVAACSRCVVPLCTREVTQLSACSGTVLGWVCVCTVPQGAQLRAAGRRAARGGTALVQAASLPRGGEAHPPHSGGSAGHPPARADGGELPHSELPLSEPVATFYAREGSGGRR
jgi:hypothetical protein